MGQLYLCPAVQVLLAVGTKGDADWRECFVTHSGKGANLSGITSFTCSDWDHTEILRLLLYQNKHVGPRLLQDATNGRAPRWGHFLWSMSEPITITDGWLVCVGLFQKVLKDVFRLLKLLKVLCGGEWADNSTFFIGWLSTCPASVAHTPHPLLRSQRHLYQATHE